MPDTDQRLTKIETKLDEISSTLAKIAVQDNRIQHLETQVNAVWQKYDDFCKPGGQLDIIQAHVASCPRARLHDEIIKSEKRMDSLRNGMIIPIAIALIGAAYSVIHLAFKI